MDDMELIKALSARANELRIEAAALDAAVVALSHRAVGMSMPKESHIDPRQLPRFASKAVQFLTDINKAQVAEATPEKGHFTELVYELVRAKKEHERFSAPDISVEILTQLGENAPSQLGTRVATILSRMADRGEVLKFADGGGRRPHTYIKGRVRES